MTNEPPSDCDLDCDDGCSFSEFPVWMRPYRCRHLSAAERRIRDIVFAESRDARDE